MSIAIGVILALVGGLSLLAGLSDMRRSRLLRSHGMSAWAMAVPWPAGKQDEGPGLAGRMLIQYELEDGRVMERICPGSLRRHAALEPGQRVLVWYNPADPQDVVVHGRDTRLADVVFVTTGMLCIAIGAAIAGSGH